MSFLDRFRPAIRILANPDEFLFSQAGAEVRLRTLIRFNEQRQIIELGEAAEREGQGGTLVRIFERPSGARRDEWFNSGAFVRFCRYGLMVVRQTAITLAPRVEVVADRQLDRLFDGRAAEILVPLIRQAGAAQVAYTVR